MRRRRLIGTCLAIAALDLAQPLLFPWVPKFVGSLAGAALYLVFAAGIHRHFRAAEWAVAAMPAIPITTLALWAAGVPLPVRPDAPMIAILSLQLLAAGLALAERLDPPTSPAAADNRTTGVSGAVKPPVEGGAGETKGPPPRGPGGGNAPGRAAASEASVGPII